MAAPPPDTATQGRLLAEQVALLYRHAPSIYAGNALAATGLALMVWRDTGAMALLLAIHLGVVMALFLTLPYGKFAHGFYRCAALLKWAIEKRMPNKLGLGSD